MKRVAIVLIVFIVTGLSGCEKESPVEVAAVTTPVYVVSPPTGKLPWPQHNPAFSQAEYNSMMSKLFIINNFGQYQGGTTTESLYFHDGIDVVAKNDTKIFAVESGYVKAIIGSNEYYMSLVIGDVKDNGPGKGWSYTHVNNFKVKVGDFVSQGTYLADIHFQGVPHVHLNRVIFNSGSWTNWGDLTSVQPDTFFTYTDEQPPVIESPFRYYRNQTDSLFPPGNPTVVSGDVDIIVGIREQGEYAHAKDASIVPVDFGDRLCPSKLEFEIEGNGVHFQRKSFDFSKIVLRYRSDQYLQVATIYKFYYSLHPAGPTSWSGVFSYFVVTNVDGSGEFGEVKTSDQSYAWNTTAKDEMGNPKFPNGRYVVRIKAYDASGLSATSIDSVEIRN
jgi:hypothetical protein